MTNTSLSRVSIDQPSKTRRAGLRAGPLVAAAAGLMLAACSTLPDWTKPSTASDAITGQSPSQTTNQTVAAQQARAEAASENSSFPTAGSTPQVPKTGDASAKRDLANSLVADRQHARYSGEALRGGTEPPASPLPSRRVAPLPDLPSTAPAGTVAAAAPSAAGVIPARDIPAFQTPARRMGQLDDGEIVETPVAAAPAAPAPTTPKVEVATLPAPTVAPAAPSAPAAVPSAAAPRVASAPVATPVRQAATAPARRAAVPARSVPTYESETIAASAPAASVPVRSAVTPVNASGQPQFAVSTAPPLPAEVRDQVPAVVAARFDETLGEPPAAAQNAGQLSAPAAQVGADGVVIDYSAIGAGSPVPATPTLEQGSTPTLPIQAYEPLEFSGAASDAEGGPFAPVAIYFGHGSSNLSAADRAQISEVAALHKKRGQGSVRVVGHASSRTNNLPVNAHLLANFEASMDRANAVANELMRKGVAASDLVIEAVGDRAPEYYESMPAGEAGNRRAEIFLE
ncbi:hypothetical protein NBRC116588_23290 [Pyruvatibacter sp. HU-CL02332]|uniref:OmpA family protein n=1 Tax=Pyruvatibacter sp. HU-CL02332 TaxID=3127650 RepID=UPI003105D4DA